jgi:hypothetical protein
MTILSAVASSTSSPLSRELTWSFIKQNWNLIHARCQSGFLFPRLIKTVTEGFFSLDKCADIEVSLRKSTKVLFHPPKQFKFYLLQDFFSKQSTAGIARSIKQGLESIKCNADWLKRSKDDIDKFLKEY